MFAPEIAPALAPDRHKSNRDAIGAVVRMSHPEASRCASCAAARAICRNPNCRSLSAWANRDSVDRIVVNWPSGATEEFKNISSGRAYEVTENKGITEISKF